MLEHHVNHSESEFEGVPFSQTNNLGYLSEKIYSQIELTNGNWVKSCSLQGQYEKSVNGWSEELVKPDFELRTYNGRTYGIEVKCRTTDANDQISIPDIQWKRNLKFIKDRYRYDDVYYVFHLLFNGLHNRMFKVNIAWIKQNEDKNNPRSNRQNVKNHMQRWISWNKFLQEDQGTLDDFTGDVVKEEYSCFDLEHYRKNHVISNEECSDIISYVKR